MSQDIDKASLLFDYERANEMILHYERLIWQIGAILLAGFFVGFSSFITGEIKPEIIDKFPLAVLVVLSIVGFWFLWYQRNRALVLPRFHRMWEIEHSFPELCQYTRSVDFDLQGFNIPFRRNPRRWIAVRIAVHAILIRGICVLLPSLLIFVYVQSYLKYKSLDSVICSWVVLFAFALLIFFIYPELTYTDFYTTDEISQIKADSTAKILGPRVDHPK